jgi:capsid protein
MRRLASMLLALMAAIGSAALPATAADMVYVSVDQPNICASDKVLNRISSRFRYQVRHVPNLPQVDIHDFYRVHESRYLPRQEDRPIERRYCQATAALSDGQTRTVWYLIERPMGFAGVGSNVEFCVSGFDRWHIYGGRCRALW